MQVDGRVAVGAIVLLAVAAAYIYQSSFRIEKKLNRILEAVSPGALLEEVADEDESPPKKKTSRPAA